MRRNLHQPASAPPGTAPFGAAVSRHPDPAQAVGEAAGAVLEAVGREPDVAFVFVCGSHIEALPEVAEAVDAILAPGAFVGATAIAVLGGATEVEEGPAVSVWAGRTGPAEAVRLEVVGSPDGTAVVGMPDAAAEGRRTLVLIAEPFGFPTEAFVDAAADQYPDLTIVGGIASAGTAGRPRLVVSGTVHDEGAVGVLLTEGVGGAGFVSQGCRPVGEPYVVTAAEGNVVRELGSRPAAERLRALLDAVDGEERDLLNRGLHVGIAIDERAERFGHGDFLVRGVLGADGVSGGIRIGDRVPVGTTLQFQVRDAASAGADLAATLVGVDAAAALVFTCNGRGSRFFGEPDHDAALVSSAVGGGAVAGMFCAGEIGPVGGRNHLHGLSAAVLLF